MYIVSDVPAPNAYNIPQESTVYKRGAFLEKADRFNKEKVETAPGTQLVKECVMKLKLITEIHKPSSSQVAAERYAALQKRVDELEKVHQDGKRNVCLFLVFLPFGNLYPYQHSFELERLKHDLAASQKSTTEATEKLEKQKKQRAALESTVQELKKASLSDQGEIKDLRHKLRLLEIERDKTLSKQPEIIALKNSLQALEIKRKDDIRDRDRKVAELEKNLQGEKKKREFLENRNLDTCQHLQEEIENFRTALQEKDNLLQTTAEEFRIAKEKFQQVVSSSAGEEEQLLQRLQQHRSLLETVTQQYGTLASQSIFLAKFDHLKQDYATLQCRQYRLERKLANSEGQVTELTHLIRQTMEQNIELDQQLRDALEHISILSHPSSSYPINLSETDDCSHILADIDKHLREEQSQLSDISRDTDALLSTYYRLKSDQLYFASSVLGKEHSETAALLEQREVDLSSALASHEAIASILESMQKDRTVDQEAFQRAIDEKEKLRSSHAVLEVRFADANQKLSELDSVHAAVLSKEKDVVQRLTTAIQKSRMAEEALRADIDGWVPMSN